MKFKIDENLPVELAQLLNQGKHNALTVLDQKLEGSDDPGIIVFRVSRQSKPQLVKVLQGLIPLFDREPIKKHLWIVEDSRVRVWGRGI